MLIDRFRALPAAEPLLAPLREQSDIYLVGGAVRDLLLGGAPGDLDLVVDGELAGLADTLGDDVRRHERFGTCTVTVGSHQYDIARARSERYREPGALPEVSPASLDEDLRRRDFTVNAIAMSLGGPQAGELRAAEGALDDLEGRLLRVLHERSFIDDPTRLLRLARYRARLGFEVEPHTRELAEAAIAGGALATVSRERIDHELALLAREPDPVAAFEAARELGIPEVERFDASLARRALELLPQDASREKLVLLVASKPDGADSVAAALARADRPSEIARAVGAAPLEDVALAGARGPREAAGTWLKQLRHVHLSITGRDLLQRAIPEGPSIGVGLTAALEAKLDGRTAGREQELAEALRAAREAAAGG